MTKKSEARLERDKERHADRDHYELGGSGAHRWANCTGSIQLARQMPEGKVGAAAERGTELHEYAEAIVKDFLDYRLTGEPKDYERKFKALLQTGKIDDDEAQWLYMYRECIWRNVLKEEITDKAYGFEDKFVLHKKLKMGGMVDFWCAYNDESGKKVLSITDLKTGFHEVDVKKNLQLLFYAAAIQEELGKNSPFEKIETNIFQPKSENAWRSATYTAAQLEKYKQKFLAAAHAIYVKKEFKFKVGSWCKFCPGQAVCEKYSTKLSNETALNFVEPKKIKFAKVNEIPDDILARLLDKKDEIYDFLKQVERYVTDRHSAGRPVAGTKMVKRKGRRVWIDDDRHIRQELKKHLAPEQYLQRKLLPLTQVEKALDNPPVFDKLVQISKPSYAAVPDTDPRPAAKKFLKLAKKMKRISNGK